MVTNNSSNNYAAARFIVSSTAGNGNYTTIQDAITAAPANSTIAIQPGTYTENLTLKSTLAFTTLTDAASGKGGNVEIRGKMIDNGVAVACSFNGIQFRTNSDFISETTANSNLLFFGCTLLGSNNTIFSMSSVSANIYLHQCSINLQTTGITYTSISAGNLWGYNCLFQNSGGSTTGTTLSGGGITIYNSQISAPLACTSGGQLSIYRCILDRSSTNTTPFTTAGTGTHEIEFCDIKSGSASSISVGSGTSLNIYNSIVNSTNTNAITGAGTASLAGVVYSNTSHQTNVTTQTGGAAFGLTQGTAPSTGCIGEQIRATIALGSAVSLTNATPLTVTSVSLTAGIWDVSGIVGFVAGASTSITQIEMSISTTNNALQGNYGDDTIANAFSAQIGLQQTLSIPSLRVTLSSTTTIYLTTQAAFTVSTLTAYGRISATRVG